MKMYCKQLNPHACRSYMVDNEDSKEVVLIDPVLEHLEEYRGLINELRIGAAAETGVGQPAPASRRRDDRMEHVLMIPRRCRSLRFARKIPLS